MRRDESKRKLKREDLFQTLVPITFYPRELKQRNRMRNRTLSHLGNRRKSLILRRDKLRTQLGCYVCILAFIYATMSIQWDRRQGVEHVPRKKTPTGFSNDCFPTQRPLEHWFLNPFIFIRVVIYGNLGLAHYGTITPRTFQIRQTRTFISKHSWDKREWVEVDHLFIPHPHHHCVGLESEEKKTRHVYFFT